MADQRINITQGEFAASDSENVMISTLLGSCVSVCLWDETAKVGGMNHMLLAVSETKSGTCNLAGLNAMEILINDIIKLGGRRNHLNAKVFGGARMLANQTEIGESNATFALEFLESEGIPCLGKSIGGASARNLKFWPASGRVLQRVTEVKVSDTPEKPKDSGNDVELF